MHQRLRSVESVQLGFSNLMSHLICIQMFQSCPSFHPRTNISNEFAGEEMNMNKEKKGQDDRYFTQKSLPKYLHKIFVTFQDQFHLEGQS